MGVDFRCLVVELGTLVIVIRPLGVDFRSLRVNFRPLGVDFRLKKLIFDLCDPIWVPGEGIYFKIGVFWCLYLETFPVLEVPRQPYVLRPQGALLVSLAHKRRYFFNF